MAPRECKGPRLFVEGLCQRGVPHLGSALPLSPDDSHYFRDVLRLPVGALIEIADPSTGDSFAATISSLTDLVTVKLFEKLDAVTSEIEIILLCALCKGQKNELICDWATELGCARIIFWQAERSIVRLRGDDDATAKATKFSNAALAAAQQSRQAKPPQVHVALSLAKALEHIPSSTTLKAICSLEPDAPVLSALTKELKPNSSVCLVIGPEGDISPEEHKTLQANGFLSASLGRQVLRSELAALTAIVAVKQR